MEEKSVLKTWWSILGKWQVSAVAVALAAFYITRYITGDNIVAGLVGAVAAASVAAAAASNTTEVSKINKKIVCLSCVAEFVVMLLPILGTVRDWW